MKISTVLQRLSLVLLLALVSFIVVFGILAWMFDLHD